MIRAIYPETSDEQIVQMMEYCISEIIHGYNPSQCRILPAEATVSGAVISIVYVCTGGFKGKYLGHIEVIEKRMENY